MSDKLMVCMQEQNVLVVHAHVTSSMAQDALWQQVALTLQTSVAVFGVGWYARLPLRKLTELTIPKQKAKKPNTMALTVAHQPRDNRWYDQFHCRTLFAST
mmetsp:Transcript_25328/g.41893  ORF Transcript_25328/g.41893 Transcript_25328/m.41893 type:complete len:101 (+) Transcript_25328:367-669(+)